MSEWLDFELIRDLAIAMPDWVFEFVGNIDVMPKELSAIENITFHPPVSFRELPSVMTRWSAAWIPFAINELTLAVNPLKIREYLAAGLPSLSTPMPEVIDLSENVKISHSISEIKDWLESILISDSAEARATRRASVSGDSWEARAEYLRGSKNDYS